MIRIRFKERLADKEFREGRNVTINEVAEQTGIHRVTLSKIANERGYNASLDSVDKLCSYFGCQPGDLLEFVDGLSVSAEKPVSAAKSGPRTSK